MYIYIIYIYMYIISSSNVLQLNSARCRKTEQYYITDCILLQCLLSTITRYPFLGDLHILLFNLHFFMHLTPYIHVFS